MLNINQQLSKQFNNNNFIPINLNEMINTFSNELQKAIQELEDFITHINVTHTSIIDNCTHNIP